MTQRESANVSGPHVSRPDIKQHQLAVRRAGNTLASYDYIAKLDRFRHRGSSDLLKERSLLNLLGQTIPRGTSVINALYSEVLGIRQFAGITFVPGGDPDLIADGQLALNTWLPPAITPTEGDPAPFLDLIGLVFDHDPVAMAFFLDAVAALIQKPGTKWAFLILLIGAQGIGKSVVCDMIADLVGRKNTAFPTVEAMRSQFTGWLLNAHLVVFHELDQIGRDVATRLKHWVTGTDLLINSKNVPEFTIRNYSNIIACSNHEHVAHLEEDDRRVFTWISQGQKREAAYYSGICEWFFHGGGTGIVLNFLLNRDIASFNPKAAPPRTIGRQRLIDNSRSEAENFLRDALESFGPPFTTDLCTANEVLQFLRVHQVRCTDAEVRHFLRQSGALSLGQCRVRGTRPNLWAVRNPEHWASASHDELASAYVSVFDQYALQLEHEAAQGEIAPMPVRRKAP